MLKLPETILSLSAVAGRVYLKIFNSLTVLATLSKDLETWKSEKTGMNVKTWTRPFRMVGRGFAAIGVFLVENIGDILNTIIDIFWWDC